VTSSGMAMTVRGPVLADELGMTLFHEHLHMDATPLLTVHGYVEIRFYTLGTGLKCWGSAVKLEPTNLAISQSASSVIARAMVKVA